MAKKGGIGKRGVGGKTNTKKTNKAALRAGFEVRHIDQVRRDGRGGRIFAFVRRLRAPTPPPRLTRHRVPASGKQHSVVVAPSSNTHTRHTTHRSGRTCAPK